MKEVYISPENRQNKASADHLMTCLFEYEEVYVLWYNATGATAVTSFGYIVDVTATENEVNLTRDRIGCVTTPQKPVITLHIPDGSKKYIELAEGDTYDTSGCLAITRASGETTKYFGIPFEISENTSLLPQVT